jgi:hypothetical protein
MIGASVQEFWNLLNNELFSQLKLGEPSSCPVDHSTMMVHGGLAVVVAKGSLEHSPHDAQGSSKSKSAGLMTGRGWQWGIAVAGKQACRCNDGEVEG